MDGNVQAGQKPGNIESNKKLIVKLVRHNLNELENGPKSCQETEDGASKGSEESQKTPKKIFVTDSKKSLGNDTLTPQKISKPIIPHQTPIKKAEPIKKVEPMKKTETGKNSEHLKKTEPAKNATPIKKAESIKKAEPFKKDAQVKKTEPLKKSEPTKKTESFSKIDKNTAKSVTTQKSGHNTSSGNKPEHMAKGKSHDVAGKTTSQKIIVTQNIVVKKTSEKYAPGQSKTTNEAMTSKSDAFKIPKKEIGSKVVPQTLQKKVETKQSSDRCSQGTPKKFEHKASSSGANRITSADQTARGQASTDRKDTEAKTENLDIKISVKEFYCQKCGLHFDDFGKLHEHIFKSTDTEHMFRCANCEYIVGKTLVDVILHTKRFCSRENFRQCEEKMANEEPDKKRYYCERCGKGVGLLSELLKHYEEHKNELLCCSECNFEGSSFLELLIHFRDHTVIGNMHLECKLCPLVFYASTPLKLHYFTVHSLIFNIPFECDLCVEVIFDDEEKFLSHVQGHCIINRDNKPDRPIRDVNKMTCEVCAEIFDTIIDCKSHKTSVHKLDPNAERECTQCKKNITISGMSSHLLCHQKEKAIILPKNTYVPKPEQPIRDRAENDNRDTSCPSMLLPQADSQTGPSIKGSFPTAHQAPTAPVKQGLLPTPSKISDSTETTKQGLLPTPSIPNVPTTLINKSISPGLTPGLTQTKDSIENNRDSHGQAHAISTRITTLSSHNVSQAQAVRHPYNTPKPWETKSTIPPLINKAGPLGNPSLSSFSPSLTSLKPFMNQPKCTKCDRTFMSLFALNEHEKSHFMEERNAAINTFSEQRGGSQASHFNFPNPTSRATNTFPQKSQFQSMNPINISSEQRGFSQASKFKPSPSTNVTGNIRPLLETPVEWKPQYGASSKSNQTTSNDRFTSQAVSPWLSSNDRNPNINLDIQTTSKTPDNPWLSNEPSSYTRPTQNTGLQDRSSFTQAAKPRQDISAPGKFLEWSSSYQELEDSTDINTRSTDFSGFPEESSPEPRKSVNLFSRDRRTNQHDDDAVQSSSVDTRKSYNEREGRQKERSNVEPFDRRRRLPSPISQRREPSSSTGRSETIPYTRRISSDIDHNRYNISDQPLSKDARELYSKRDTRQQTSPVVQPWGHTSVETNAFKNQISPLEPEEGYLDQISYTDPSDVSLGYERRPPRRSPPPPMRRRSNSKELARPRDRDYDRRRSRSPLQYRFTPPESQRRRSRSPPMRERRRSRSPGVRDAPRRESPIRGRGGGYARRDFRR